MKIQRRPGLLLPLTLISLSAVVGQGPPPAAATSLKLYTGQVVDRAGRPVPGLLVFASDRRTDAIEAMAMADQLGTLRFLLSPGPPHNFGVLSATVAPLLVRLQGPAAFQLVVGRLEAPGKATGAGSPVPIEAGGPRVIRGRVLDDLGVGLRGAFIEAHPASGALKTAAVSDERGDFALAVPGGPGELTVHAVGLKVRASRTDKGRLILTMTIDAEPQQLVVSDGHMLRFDPQDSIDPEYSPPAPVRAWLLHAYGICPNTGPLTFRQKQGLQKYWYLDLLRQAPPSPASISTADCTPAHLHEQLPPEMVRVQGFVTWVENARPPE